MMKKMMLITAVMLMVSACTLPSLPDPQHNVKKRHYYSCEEIVASAERLRKQGYDIQVNMQCMGSKKRGYPTR